MRIVHADHPSVTSSTPIFLRTLRDQASAWPDDEHANTLVDRIASLGGDPA